MIGKKSTKTKPHGCNAKVDALLKERNTRLVVSFLNPHVAVLRTEIVEAGRGRRPVAMFATHCPFCGERYSDADLHPLSREPSRKKGR